MEENKNEKAAEPTDKCSDCGLSFPEADFFNRVICRYCQIKLADHPQVLVTCNDGEQFHVDTKLAELVLLLNNAGYETRNSCQANEQREGQDIAWLEFRWGAVTKLQQLFLDICNNNETFFQKMQNYEWRVIFWDEKDFEKEQYIDMSLSLRFPASDIVTFTNVLNCVCEKNDVQK